MATTARIPLDRILPYITDHVSKYDSIEALAFRARLEEDTLYHYLIGRTSSIDFDVADRLICAMNRPHLWTHELADIYYSVDLSGEPAPVPDKGDKRRCLRDGCMVEFVPSPHHPNRQKFCSPACRAATQRKRRLARQGRTSHRYGTKNGACPRGHDRSEENVRKTKDGRYACRVCAREDAKKKYKANPELRERKKQRERERRALRKAA